MWEIFSSLRKWKNQIFGVAQLYFWVGYMGQSLDLSPNSLLNMMPQLFTKHHYIFEMVRIFPNTIVLIFWSLEMLEYFWPFAQNHPGW